VAIGVNRRYLFAVSQCQVAAVTLPLVHPECARLWIAAKRHDSPTGHRRLNKLRRHRVGERFARARQHETVVRFFKQAESDEFARLNFK